MPLEAYLKETPLKGARAVLLLEIGIISQVLVQG